MWTHILVSLVRNGGVASEGCRGLFRGFCAVCGRFHHCRWCVSCYYNKLKWWWFFQQLTHLGVASNRHPCHVEGRSVLLRYRTKDLMHWSRRGGFETRPLSSSKLARLFSVPDFGFWVKQMRSLVTTRYLCTSHDTTYVIAYVME